MLRCDFLPNHPEIKVYQDDDMFLINTDTQVLGEFLSIKHKDIVLDLGTNTGGLLLYASLFQPKKLFGLDVNEKALELAKKNMEENHVENVELIHANLLQYTIDELVDVVICNPPYFNTPSQLLAENEYKTLAKHESGGLTLPLLIQSISRNLRDGGTLFFLFLTSRMEEVILELEKNNIAVKEMKFIYDENKEHSNVFVMRGVKNGKLGMVVDKPIIISRKK